jgi:hypothetical protein
MGPNECTIGASALLGGFGVGGGRQNSSAHVDWADHWTNSKTAGTGQRRTNAEKLVDSKRDLLAEDERELEAE